MNMKKLLKASLLALPILASTIPLVVLKAAPANAAGFCQCPDYIQNKTGIRNTQDAKNWDNTLLPSNGYSRLSGPRAGAIAVMEANFPGADTTYGHIGYVEQVLSNGQIDLRGTNQSVGGNPFTEANCTNVRITRFGTSTTGEHASKISFWVKNNTTPVSPDPNPFRAVSFTITTNRTYATNVRSGPSLNDRVLRQLATNTSVRMDGWKYGSTVNDMWTGKPDSRWYRIAGTNEWVSSAVVAGNAPNSNPMP
jgi:surface antigen